MNTWSKCLLWSLSACSCNPDLDIFHATISSSDVGNSLWVSLRLNKLKNEWVLIACLFEIFPSNKWIKVLYSWNTVGWFLFGCLSSWLLFMMMTNSLFLNWMLLFVMILMCLLLLMMSRFHMMFNVLLLLMCLLLGRLMMWWLMLFLLMLWYIMLLGLWLLLLMMFGLFWLLMNWLFLFLLFVFSFTCCCWLNFFLIFLFLHWWLLLFSFDLFLFMGSD